MSDIDIETTRFSPAGLSTANVTIPAGVRQLEFEFEIGREPPARVFMDGANVTYFGVDTESGGRRWIVRFDLSDASDTEARDTFISWLTPYQGGELLRARPTTAGPQDTDKTEAAATTAATPRDTNYIEEFKKALAAANDDPARTTWLKIDFATSLPFLHDDDYEEAARLTGVDAWLLKSLDPIQRTRVVGYLLSRTICRASSHALGHAIPFVDPGDLRTPIEVSALIIREILHQHPRDAWALVVDFARGALRNDGDSDRLNIEPNSFVTVTFAEMFDIACDPHRTSLDHADRLACAEHRRAFVAFIEPFAATYRAHGPLCSRVAAYDRRNFYAQLWDESTRDHHIREIKALPDDVAIERRWARDLFRALRDEDQVLRCMERPA